VNLMQLECYDCGFVGTLRDFQTTEPPDLVDAFENTQRKKALTCPDCGGQQLGPQDEEIFRL
jgi:hypothetical protein